MKTFIWRGGAATARVAVLIAFGGAGHAQDSDRAEEASQAARRVLPVVTTFDRKTPVPVADMAVKAAPATAAADPGFGSSTADVARIRAMDVAGVRIGMAPDRVRAALHASGYAPVIDPSYTDRRAKVERNDDYPARVDRARHQWLNDGVTWRQFSTVVAEEWQKGDERVRVEYVPMREGVQVASVAYRIPEGRIGWPAIRSSVTAKYGRPTRLSKDLRTVRWRGDGACAAVGPRYVELSLTDGWRVELTDGGALERLSTGQALVDADASIRKTDKPSF